MVPHIFSAGDVCVAVRTASVNLVCYGIINA